MTPQYPRVLSAQYLADRFQEEAARGLAASNPRFDPKTALPPSALRLLKASNAFFELMKRK